MRPAAVAVIIATVIIVAGICWVGYKAGRRERQFDQKIGTIARFDDIAVTATRLVCRVGRRTQVRPLAGVHASVETVGELTQRVTVTRTALFGVFALALRKRQDHRSLFLTIEGPGVAVVREIPVRANPGIQKAARGFAAAVNAQAMAAEGAPRDAVPPTSR